MADAPTGAGRRFPSLHGPFLLDLSQLNERGPLSVRSVSPHM
jgi:hypothetical protein